MCDLLLVAPGITLLYFLKLKLFFGRAVLFCFRLVTWDLGERVDSVIQKDDLLTSGVVLGLGVCCIFQCRTGRVGQGLVLVCA